MSQLSTIADAVRTCTSCGLHRTRTNAVPGAGPDDAKIMLVGEGPGAGEDEVGLPFVGDSGKLLTRLLSDAGIQRDTVFVTNSVKCRPPGNRDPKPEETAACKGHLKGQIRALRPKVIITCGKFAAWHVTMTTGPVSALMAQQNLTCIYGNDPIPVVACYHPAYLLRLLQSDRERAKAVYQDYISRLQRAATLAV